MYVYYSITTFNINYIKDYATFRSAFSKLIRYSIIEAVRQSGLTTIAFSLQLGRFFPDIPPIYGMLKHKLNLKSVVVGRLTLQLW